MATESDRQRIERIANELLGAQAAERDALMRGLSEADREAILTLLRKRQAQQREEVAERANATYQMRRVDVARLRLERAVLEAYAGKPPEDDQALNEALQAVIQDQARSGFQASEIERQADALERIAREQTGVDQDQ
jgi:hypothetical protein